MLNSPYANFVRDVSEPGRVTKAGAEPPPLAQAAIEKNFSRHGKSTTTQLRVTFFERSERKVTRGFIPRKTNSVAPSGATPKNDA